MKSTLITAIDHELRIENERLRSQQPPCSLGCYRDKTRPCEDCGLINGYLPSIWEALMKPFNLEAAKDAAITRALAETKGHRAKAARLLGVSVRTLQREIQRRTSD